MKFKRKPVNAELKGDVYFISDELGNKWTMPRTKFEALYEPVENKMKGGKYGDR